METRIRELRAGKKLTQQELADLVGVRRETIVFLEQGKYNPSLRLAWAVSRALDSSVEDVFSFSDDELGPDTG